MLFDFYNFYGSFLSRGIIQDLTVLANICISCLGTCYGKRTAFINCFECSQMGSSQMVDNVKSWLLIAYLCTLLVGRRGSNFVLVFIPPDRHTNI